MRQQTRPLKEPAEKVVQDIRRATRKHYLAEEKIRIVLEGLRGEDSIAELIRFRHFCSGSLALASLDRACRNPVPAFPQRSPPRLLTAAACGGLRSAPDRRSRRVLLHLSYSCAPPCTHGDARDTRPTADLRAEETTVFPRSQPDPTRTQPNRDVVGFRRTRRSAGANETQGLQHACRWRGVA